MRYGYLCTFEVFFEDGEQGLYEMLIITDELSYSDVEAVREAVLKDCTDSEKMQANSAILINCTKVIYDVEKT